MVDFITNIDVSILNFIREFLSCKVLDVIFSFITSLGDNGIIWLCCAAVLLFFKKYNFFILIIKQITYNFFINRKLWYPCYIGSYII